MKTSADYGMFKGEVYIYPEVKVRKDNDSRFSRKDSWSLVSCNERIYLTTKQMIELRDLLTLTLGEIK